LSKLLTTGQMIDQLKVGEVAVGKNGFYEGYKVKKTDYHEIVPVKKETNNFLVMNTFTSTTKWSILPKYVTFEEAIEAMKEGKTVRIHISSNMSKVVEQNHNMNGLGLGEFGFYTFIKSKWSIEE
jgi:pyruvate-formate lyase